MNNFLKWLFTILLLGLAILVVWGCLKIYDGGF